MNLSKTIVLKKVLFTKKEIRMKKVMMIIVQVLIFTGAWFVMTPDQVVDNTYVFGLIGSYDLVRGNTHWVLIGAALLSIINILVWWPTKTVTVVKTEEVKADPVVPKMD